MRSYFVIWNGMSEPALGQPWKADKTGLSKQWAIRLLIAINVRCVKLHTEWSNASPQRRRLT
jgi:hypothetical protein